ncbi:hypothetical protein ADK56_21225 [Streptomyces sp. MMG1522]|nr:hypothetical protein ADK56_21225 [Streptomyces sp. MMG1522]
MPCTQRAPLLFSASPGLTRVSISFLPVAASIVRQVGDSGDTEDPLDLVVRRRGRSTGPSSWTQYDPVVLAVLPERSAATSKT